MKRAAALDTCRLIIVNIYFGSGIQKLNSAFVRGSSREMLAPFTWDLLAAVMARHSLAVVGWMLISAAVFAAPGKPKV